MNVFSFLCKVDVSFPNNSLAPIKFIRIILVKSKKNYKLT